MTREMIHVVTGPAHHGVVRFGLQLHEQLRRNGFAASLCREASADTVRRGCGSQRAVHVQFTDRLFGADPELAAVAFADMATAARAGGCRVTATLHDLPQPSDGSRYQRRANAYAMVADACNAVVVSSDHERALLRDSGIDIAEVAVIPLPIEHRGAHATSIPAVGDRSIGVFGFLYPGKGHDDVIAAAKDLPPDVEVVAIGAPSAGHEDLVADLSAAAARQGRRFRVTGHVEDCALLDALRRVAVPVAAHRHISASGSLNTWLAAGRRPLAPANRYTSELERRNPGSVALYPDTPSGLTVAVRAALNDPASTWLTADVTLTPSPGDAAAAYADFFDRS